MPVSRTENRNVTSSSTRDTWATDTVISPCSVNLMALPTRFINT